MTSVERSRRLFTCPFCGTTIESARHRSTCGSRQCQGAKARAALKAEYDADPEARRLRQQKIRDDIPRTPCADCGEPVPITARSGRCQPCCALRSGLLGNMANKMKPKKPKPVSVKRVAVKKDTRGPIRRAYEDEQWQDLQAALLARTVRDGSCRIWQGSRQKDGYGEVAVGKDRRLSVHRLMMRSTGVDAKGLHVHHVCAQTMCINPDHLSVETAAANTAEMLERHWYRRRIAELEAELRRVDPGNRLTQQIPFWDAA